MKNSPSHLMGLTLKVNTGDGKEERRLAKAVAKLWGRDPVHPTEQTYRKLATEILETYQKMTREAEKTDDDGDDCVMMGEKRKETKREPIAGPSGAQRVKLSARNHMFGGSRK